jgi:hypothetical protein
MQRRQDREGKEPKALVEITVTWHEPDAKAEGKWWRPFRKSGLRVFLGGRSSPLHSGFNKK